MIIGIDLGTTNSLVAVWQAGAPKVIPNVFGDLLTPSVVGVDDDGQILVGRAARERLITHPQHTTAIFKRYMGSNRSVLIGTRSLRPEELSALVLKSLKADAEAYLGETVTEAIITVPAYFSDAQRKATRVAGELAGLKVERLLNEPTAAALAYGLHELGAESRFLVFDLGGGTFDISILELFEGVMEVRASAGDNFLGGEDFVEVLIDAFIREVGAAQGLKDKHESNALYQALHDQAERVKRELSNSESAEFCLRYREQDLRWKLNQERFAYLAEPLLARLRTPIERALRDAKLRAADLNAVVLAGGATRKPMIRKLVAKLFGRLPACNLNPDEVVAMGAAVQAGLKMRDAALSEVVMTDVCPYTLGINISKQIAPNQRVTGHYLPVIERNSVVPVSRVETVYTVADNQRKLLLEVYQGESRLVKDNIFLGKLEVQTPARPAGEVAAEVRFTYDVNGILEVEAHLPLTGETARVVIEENPGVLSASEIEAALQRLQNLKIHPRERMEVRAALARAERLYEQQLGDARDYVQQITLAFEAVVARQDTQEIARALAELQRRLDAMEGESVF